ncbi:MAG: hypothetical protein ACO1RX_08535 [Candidatus Sericytochromatia bacterium]
MLTPPAPSASVRSLHRLLAALELAGFPAHLIPASRDMPFEQLLVALDEDDEAEVQFPLYLFYQEDVLQSGEPSHSPLRAELERSATLCFVLELARPLPEDLLSFYRLLNQLSALLPVGTLGVIEDEAVTGLGYRYTLPQSEAPSEVRANTLTVVEVLDLMRFYLNRMLPRIDAWLATEIEIVDIVADVERALAAESIGNADQI